MPRFAVMGANPQLTARVQEEVLQRVDRLADALNAKRDLGSPSYERTDVVRRLILRALAEEEREHGLAPATAKKGPAPARKPAKK